MTIGWNFPSCNYSEIHGISDAGIETYKGSPYQSLAREICQNSLDARLGDEPVLIEFSCFDIPTTNIDCVDQLKDALNSCYVVGRDTNDEKTKNFFSKSLDVINSNFDKRRYMVV